MHQRQVSGLVSGLPESISPSPPPPPPPPPAAGPRGILKARKDSLPKASGRRVAFGDTTVHEVSRWIVPRKRESKPVLVVSPLPSLRLCVPPPPLPAVPDRTPLFVPGEVAVKKEDLPAADQDKSTSQVLIEETNEPRPFGRGFVICALVAAACCMISDLWYP